MTVFGQLRAMLDRFGHTLQAGDAVIVLTKADTIWHIHSITPHVDPKDPPGMLKVELLSHHTVIIPKNTPLPDVVLAFSIEEQKARIAAQNMTPPPGNLPKKEGES